jgi:hypothetical protein
VPSHRREPPAHHSPVRACGDPADWEALYKLESMTNPRIRNEVGELSLVPVADRVSGPNASVVMAPFTHLSPQGTRFTDGHFGAYYAAESIDTAIAETRFHRENFLRATTQPPMELEMRCYLADVSCELHDLRGRRNESARHLRSRELLRLAEARPQLRDAGSNGIAFNSVRRSGGECVAVFRPRLVQNVRQSVHLRTPGMASPIANVYEMRALNL